MFVKRIYTSSLFSMLLLLSFNSFSQPFSESLKKANSLQLISYKPKKAKAGKSGSERVVLIQLLKGPKDGKSGKDGTAGPNLKVNIAALKIADSIILQLLVRQIPETKNPDTFYVNPRYGQIKIMADGGDGGNGGQPEADGASPGTGGKGGMGGQIEVIFDYSALAYANCKCLLFSNEGGIGGWSGENYGKAGEPGTKGLPIYFKEPNGKIIFIR